MKFTTTDHVRLHYTDTGETDKPVILGIPGIGGSLQMWRDAMALFQPDYRIVLLDPRNQGQSERTFKGQRISRHAADVAELIDYLGLHDVIAIGNSMGAAHFWAYLDQYGKGELKCLVDLDQAPKMIADSTWKYGFKDLTWDNYPSYLKLPFGKAFATYIDDEMFQAAKEEYAKYPYDPAENYDCLVDHAEKDWRDIIVESPIPMLVLAGEKSPYFDPKFTEAVKALNDKVETKIIPNCGHLVQAEQPEAMHEAVVEFWKKIK
ncbi:MULTISPECIES: alpha/beta fold hydrolase [Lactobacillus]|uniref:Alpha/beta hydrolase n=1 Tax=Lactobacillus xujianguonis TaxID=2495899 RepID=A0A437STK4_9LACO|nr:MULTISPECIES: alpha/beta hydrolase [Lactobacillus]RVU70225.1 alpha/beta hydrolase [Lactobacillus xujianguonis]RVU73375.1 alpha/beta hydrolase [Lactobacillus xujianguonis]